MSFLYKQGELKRSLRHIENDFTIKDNDICDVCMTVESGVMIFVLSLLLCLLPRAFKRFKIFSCIIPFANLISAGFLLAVLLLDFIPHMILSEHGSSHDHETNTTVGLVFSGISFLLLLIIDNLILKHNHCENSEDFFNSGIELKQRTANGYQADNDSLCEVVSTTSSGSLESPNDQEVTIKGTSYNNNNNISVPSSGCCNVEKIRNTNSKTKALVFILSISIHSFSEGLAFKNSGTFFSSYELSIVAHKLLESISIGLAFADTSISMLCTVLYIILYSILTPLGMITGYYLKSFSPYIANISVFMICQGLALGSLLFIVFIEMIASAFENLSNKKTKVFTLVISYIMATIMILMIPHTH